MNLKIAESKLALITPQIIKLEIQGKTAYTDTVCAALWKEARDLTKLIKLLKL
mgnify:CR=1 FL=1